MLPNVGVYMQLQTFRIKLNFSICWVGSGELRPMSPGRHAVFAQVGPMIFKRARGFPPKPECSFGHEFEASDLALSIYGPKNREELVSDWSVGLKGKRPELSRQLFHCPVDRDFHEPGP